MHTIPDTFMLDEIPTRPINDGPTLLRIRGLARVARERLELAPDVTAAADALADVERLATEALR